MPAPSPITPTHQDESKHALAGAGRRSAAVERHVAARRGNVIHRRCERRNFDLDFAASAPTSTSSTTVACPQRSPRYVLSRIDRDRRTELRPLNGRRRARTLSAASPPVVRIVSVESRS